MRHSRAVLKSFLLAAACFLISCARQSSPTAAESSSEPPVAEGRNTPGAYEPAPPDAAATRAPMHAHSDHDSKHGGTFFMAMDNKHHLEGVLVPPGVFRVYLYDEYTRPVSPEDLARTQAEVIWGDVDGAPKIPLKPSQDGAMLEVPAPEPVRFPITLTLLMRFPGMAANQRAELFTFPISHYPNFPPGGH